MRECLHCKEVNQVYRIETPSDLVHAIKVIAGNIADGTIIEDSRKPQGQMTITILSEGGHWGSYESDESALESEIGTIEEKLTSNDDQ